MTRQAKLETTLGDLVVALTEETERHVPDEKMTYEVVAYILANFLNGSHRHSNQLHWVVGKNSAAVLHTGKTMKMYGYLSRRFIARRRKMLKPKNIIVALLTTGLLTLTPAALRAGVPTDQVRQTADRVLSVLQDSRLKSPDKQQERRAQIRQIIGNRFDFGEMAKRSLGPNWQKVNNDEQRQFVELFTELLEKSYADQIESYNGEKIVYGRENVSQDQADVDTKIVTKKGEEISVNYKLRSEGGDWKVYDVVIENISIVNNFRSQFNRILANASFAELLKKLQSKSVEIKPARGW
jgi:phospholipid transport system substrate-binding protein